MEARIPPSWTLKHGTTQSDTVWGHVSISWWQQFSRTAIVYFFIMALIIGFAIPVTVIGSLSQINYLTNEASWLAWMRDLPYWLVATIQGALPPILLAVVTAAVPIAIRVLVKLKGLHSRQATENHVQIYYFTFIFVQGFLAISLSAGITTIVGELDHTVQAVPAVLAQNLPKACNYFFSYIILSTVTTTVSTLLHPKHLLNLFVLSPAFDKTPRQKWARADNVSLQMWGTLIPVFTNIACIGLIYSLIAPIILFFNLIYFLTLWILYRSHPPKLNEFGLGNSGFFYPTAMRQLFTGVYFMELCMSGLFFLVRDDNNKASCTPHAIIMMIATASTALFHHTLDWNFWKKWDDFRGTTQIRGDRTCKRERGELPTEILDLSQARPAQDDALVAPRPVIWIPRDELEIADYEICSMRRIKGICISNEGAFLDKRGKIKLLGPPPSSSKS